MAYCGVEGIWQHSLFMHHTAETSVVATYVGYFEKYHHILSSTTLGIASSWSKAKWSCLLLTVESFDRSTTREYGDLSKDISSKYDALKKSENEVVKQENERYKSILKQVS